MPRSPFLDDETFLLSTETARRLYHEHAAKMPIYDYHCHLPPKDLAENRQFTNLFEIWLEGDHYKWRAMRAAGVEEKYCTGGADPYDKFLAFARTVPQTLRNPLYHWTHLELRRYFGIDALLSEHTAREIWDEANQRLKSMRVGDILAKFDVALVGTTDDPADDLRYHQQLRDHSPYATTIVPAFRPDKAHSVLSAANFNAYVDRLAAANAGIARDSIASSARQGGADSASFYGFLDLLRDRHAFFHDLGSRLSDHGLTHIPLASCSDTQAKNIYDQLRAGNDISQQDADRFTVWMLLFFGELDHDKGWTQQYHLGAMRNNNGWALRHLGPDTGFDSIGDYPQGEGLSAFLGALAGREKLAKTVLYNLNPADNYLFAGMVGNFQSSAAPGWMQHGSGWWFLDQAQGMRWQLDALSNLGLLSRFVGMLTDSRSFMSYPRHEYFRRLLCDMLGHDAERGELPDDMELLSRVVEDICFHNARRYFNMPLHAKYG